jgi:predicted DNA-binding protein (MmcQ/YjbR family)
VLCVSGASAGALSFKVGQEAFLAWTDRPGVQPAPYLARGYWVPVAPESGIAPRKIKAAIRASYALVAAGLTRAVRTQLGIEARPI